MYFNKYERFQKKSSQNVPIWHVDYFELKAIKTKQIQDKLFFISLKLPKRIWIGTWPKKRTITEITFFYLNDLSVWQEKHLFTKHLVLLSCESPFSPFKPLFPIPFLSSRWNINLNWPALLRSHCSFPSPIHM